MTTETFISHSEEETERLGAEFATSLRPGNVVLLTGDLGAGKTAFVRGIAAGLGLPADEVSSPTFTLVQHYKGGVPLYHVDLYRLSSHAEAEDLGLDELADAGIVAIEWAEKLGRVPAGAIQVTITDAGGDTRSFRVLRS